MIVFEYPEDPSKDFIKRVIGTPGDVVEGRAKKVYVNGKLYENPHEVHKEKDIIPKEMNPRDTFGPVTVPADSYFMMGDNRDNSSDSRYWGPLSFNNVKARAFIIYFSFQNVDNSFSFSNPLSWLTIPAKIRWTRLGKLID